MSYYKEKRPKWIITTTHNEELCKGCTECFKNKKKLKQPSLLSANGTEKILKKYGITTKVFPQQMNKFM